MTLPRTSDNPWQTRSSRVVYETRWMRVREDQVITPGGTEGTWGYVELPHPEVVAIAALDAGDRLHLVRQWRYAWGRDSWELPAGRGEAGETPLESAQRELLEETGLRAASWQSVGMVYGSASIAVRFHIFLAMDLEQGAPNREREEQDMIVQAVPLAEAVEAVMDGEIVHAASAAGILRVARLRGL